MELWGEELICAITFSAVTSLTQIMYEKAPKLAFHVPVVIGRWKSMVKGNLRWSIRFWNHYLKILKFWIPVVTSSTQNWFKKVQIGISCTNVDRKMKIKSERNFPVTYLFMKLFFSKSRNSSTLLWSYHLNLYIMYNWRLKYQNPAIS